MKRINTMSSYSYLLSSLLLSERNRAIWRAGNRHGKMRDIE